MKPPIATVYLAAFEEPIFVAWINEQGAAMNIDPEAWLDCVKHYGKNHNTVIGTKEGMKQFCRAIGRNWFCTNGYSLRIYQASPA
jgi:hypothetical protein